MKTFISSVGFQDEAGTLLRFGSLIMTLPQGMYEITAGGGQVVGGSRIINFDVNAKVPAGVTGWANDELNPQTTYQITTCSSPNGVGKVGFATWLITGGSPIDLSLMVNISGGITPISIPGVVFTQPASPQVINGQTLTMEGAALGFSAAASTTPDVFENRGSAGLLNIGTTTSNAAGTVNAAAYQVGGTGMTGSAGIVRSTSPTITTPTLLSPTITGTATFTGTVDAAAFTVSGAAMDGSSGGLVRGTGATLTTPTLVSPVISGTIDATAYKVGGVASTGTGGLVQATSPTITSPTITGSTSLLGQTLTEFRIQNYTGLSVTAPNALQGQEFTFTATWSSPFADASYLVIAQVQAASAGTPVVVGATAASASTVTVTFANLSAVQSTVTAVLLIAFHF